MNKDSTSADSSRERYSVLDALSDAVTALRYNLGTVVAIVAIGMLLTFSVLVFAVVLIAFLLNGSTSDIDIENSLGAIIIIAILTGVLLALVSSFTFSAYSKLAHEGSKSRKIDVSRTIEFAKGRTKPVFLTSVYATIVIAGPLFVSGVGSILFARNDIAIWSFIFSLATFASLVWMFIALFRFAFAAQQVAVFEKVDGPKAALLRSSELMDRPSKWFFLKLILLIGAFSIALELVFPDGGLSTMIVNIVSLAVGVITNGALTLLYLRRVKETKS